VIRSCVALVSGFTLLLFTGCSPAAASGTVTLGGDAGEACVSTQTGQPMLIGEVLSVQTAAVTVRGVELARAAGVRVVDSYMLPVGGTVIGTSQFPPEDSTSWGERVPAVGSQLNPGVSYNVVVKVERTDPAAAGSASALKVSYSSGGSTRDAEGTTRYQFAAKCF
jgi:hypothetical protein